MGIAVKQNSCLLLDDIIRTQKVKVGFSRFTESFISFQGTKWSSQVEKHCCCWHGLRISFLYNPHAFCNSNAVSLTNRLHLKSRQKMFFIKAGERADKGCQFLAIPMPSLNWTCTVRLLINCTILQFQCRKLKQQKLVITPKFFRDNLSLNTLALRFQRRKLKMWSSFTKTTVPSWPTWRTITGSSVVAKKTPLYFEN